ncbi:MarR family winged helix-turn-helix transcriptional regulator [Nonomuraea sp. NPDC048826]|uniref:MarR family winged helix-turn-helix transcriptional regulator n=1 Tax=Nonomuraea sp. NPDC048826 TaxID=3364347 RepID=UPI00371267EE
MNEAEQLAEAERNLCGLVSGTARLIEDHVRERAAKLGLTAPQATALRELTGPMTLRELSDRMSCEPSNATFIADKLEGRGLIERRAHPQDRRAKQLVLTPEGRSLRERLLGLLSAESPLGALSRQEQETLRDLLLRARGT